MIKSNIKGLASVLNKLATRITKLEKTAKQVVGGKGVRVRETSSSYIVNGDAGQGDSMNTESSCSFGFYVTSEESDDGVNYFLRSSGGTLNGVLPLNYNLITQVFPVSQDFIYLIADTTTDGIYNVRYEKHPNIRSFTAPFGRNVPPDEFAILVAIVRNLSVKSFICENLSIAPQLVYRDESAYPPVPVYSWAHNNDWQSSY